MEINKVSNISTESIQQDKVVSQKSTEEKVFNPFNSSDSTSVKKANGVSASPFAQSQVDPIDAGEIARKEVLNYFKNSFVGSEKYKTAFGDKKWDDIASSVIYRLDLHRNREAEMSTYQGKAYVFNVEANGVTGQVAIDKKSGALKLVNLDAE